MQQQQHAAQLLLLLLLLQEARPAVTARCVSRTVTPAAASRAPHRTCCPACAAPHLLPVLGQEQHMRQVVGVQAGSKAAQHVEHVPADVVHPPVIRTSST